ncbi:MAG TPA: hypothetical protein VJT71_06025, partial [Pyrinomonadaceae bacterium]|nr:hypothetical protein [Pyrinomonadaceae bacterium]
MILRLLVILSTLLIPVQLLAQPGVVAPKDAGTVATEELEAVIIESANLDNKNAVVNVKARAAMLVSFS